ncbi:MAG: 50S ribosomal protein L23 [Euryarchaeota archaeon]|nr:50S ribosomal protein L23 [Euryarchaeota archaeon]
MARDPEAYGIILHPSVTEKTMFQMDQNNSLEFVVRIDATKTEVLWAIKEIFDVDVTKIRTRITKHGKRAIVTFPADVSAEEIGMRIGVF